MGIGMRFRIRTKLMLSALAFIVPIGTMAGLIVQGYSYDIRFSTLELYGNQIIAPLTEIAVAAVLAAGPAGDATGRAAIQAAERVDRAAERLLATHQSVGEDLQFTPAGLALRGRDELMPPAVVGRWAKVKQLTGTARVDATADFFADVTEMIVHAGDTSNLILDPDLDSYYLMDVTLLGVPALLTGIYSAASVPALSATDAAVEREFLRREFNRIEASTNTAINEDPNFYGELDGLADTLTPALRRYRESAESLDAALSRIVNGGSGGVSDRYATATPALEETIVFWNTVAEQQNRLLNLRVASYRRGLFIAIILSVLATVLAFTLVTLIGRSIVRRVGETQRALATAADKDLTVHIAARSRDELGAAAEAAGLLIGNTRSFVQWLRTQATNTRTYAEKLSDGGVSLQESSNSVASGVEELSAAVEEFSRTLEQIEQNARRQETLATESSREAAALRDGYAAAAETMVTVAQTSADNTRVSEESVHVVAETIDDVHAITNELASIGQAVRSAGEASSGVDPIVATVRDIAERTSLLAMNAAIEAAHAGDRGRGFAVVAAEIRALSARTSEALQQIETQLNTLRVRISEAVETTDGAETHASRIGERTAHARDSLETVRTNATTVGRMINTMQETVTAQTQAVQRVSEAVGNVGVISAGVLSAIAEQTAGAHEMVDSVRVIKEATDHNRAVAHDVSALSQTLTDQSREIDEQVSEYRVER